VLPLLVAATYLGTGRPSASQPWRLCHNGGPKSDVRSSISSAQGRGAAVCRVARLRRDAAKRCSEQTRARATTLRCTYAITSWHATDADKAPLRAQQGIGASVRLAQAAANMWRAARAAQHPARACPARLEARRRSRSSAVTVSTDEKKTCHSAAGCPAKLLRACMHARHSPQGMCVPSPSPRVREPQKHAKVRCHWHSIMTQCQ
jgi:hypothetical protein